MSGELGAARGRRTTLLLLQVGRVGFGEEQHILGMAQSAVRAAVNSSVRRRVPVPLIGYDLTVVEYQILNASLA